MIHFIIGLFQGISLLTAVLLIMGMLLCVVEVFVPKVGFTGLFGVVLLGSGFSSYYIDGFRLKHIISLLAIITLALALFIMIELILEGKGVIKNPNRYKFRTYSNSNDGLSDLVGKQGKAITNIDLGGTVEINGKLYYAVSNNGIAQGSIVEVIGVQNNALVVK